MSVIINSVKKGSPADIHGICTDDELIAVNNHPIRDVLDYMYYCAENSLSVAYRHEGRIYIKRIHKSEFDDLGLEFETFLMDKKQHCKNKCVFCFIDQLPKGMRDTLYFKDDDARLSFLQGNYITLTNLTDDDVQRIIDMRLNVNVSVHTTNPELRVKMMKNPHSGEDLRFLWKMAEAGIMINAQIVLCPDLNDGDELRRTLSDLGSLMPSISSVAVVPLGVTKFREGLYPLRQFEKEDAISAIEIIEGFQKEFLEKYGTRLVFPSDEFYLKAGLPIPPEEFYEGYPQYENGVGMLRSIEDEFFAALDGTAVKRHKTRVVSIATGVSAYDHIAKFAQAANERFPYIHCNVFRIINEFFGETITVTGLLTAQDIIKQLRGKRLGTELLLSSSMIKKDSDLFLDDMHISDVERELDIKVRLVENDGKALLDAILKSDK
ncbi:MAG: DUF512 domain-containing protein [Oscillospiraceae bacterium]|nr:DUF512 domain-containing protein [Oscillospiraceae bacterium]